MKNLKLLVLIFIILTSFSCDENFNPYGDFVEKYSFTCILKSDENFQTATLFTSYRPAGFDPYTNSTDPSVFGADVRVWYNDSVFVFKDTSVTREDTSRYNTPFQFYYNSQFHVENRKTIELEVLLPNGRRLRSSSLTPSKINFENKSDVIVPPGSKNFVQIFWSSQDEETFFLPILTIRYKQNINGQVVDKAKDVPVRYINRGSEMIPIYPDPSSSLTALYDLNAITSALKEISEGDSQKQNYSVLEKLYFKVEAYDMATTRYISSTGGRIDDLTVSVDVADYTNIEGGFGLFGSYSKNGYTRLRFLQDYIESFNYNFIVEN